MNINMDYLLGCCDSFLKLARLEFDQEAFSKLMGAVKHCIGVRYRKKVEEGELELSSDEEKERFLAKCDSFLQGDYLFLNNKLEKLNNFWWSKYSVRGWDQVNLVVIFNEQGKREKDVVKSMEGSRALFSTKLGGVIYVDISEPEAHSSEELDMLVDYNRQSVQHELRHLKQVEYKKKEMTEWGGLPGRESRHEDPEVNWEGRIGTSGGKIHHYLRDVEFYTNLMDAVDNFCRIYGDASGDELKELIRIRVCAELDVEEMNYSIDDYQEVAWEYSKTVGNFSIAPSALFYAWKKYGGESKWRLGVREFVKAVGKKLNIT